MPTPAPTPSLEQQLADAIAAQNALTQEVANWKGKIDLTIQDLKQQAASAMESTRVYSRGGVTRAKSVAQYQGNDTYGAAIRNGVWILKTPIPMMSDTMVRFDVKGYDYGEGKVIDFTVVTYVYQGSTAPDGTLGYFINNSAQRKGNTSKSGIWLAEDPATKNACLVFGTPQSVNYYVSFVVDATFHAAVPSTNPNDWSVSCNNSAAPASGAATGFGLINLLTL